MNDLNFQFNAAYMQNMPGTSMMPMPIHIPIPPPVAGTSAIPAPSAPAGGTAPGPIRRRRFSTAKIQPTRIKKVMQSDEEIGRMVASVPVAIGRAMEHFAEKFLQAAAMATHNNNSRTLTPSHMKQAIMLNPHFRFLEPIFKDVSLPGKMPTFEDPDSARYNMNLGNFGGMMMPNMMQYGAMPSPNQLASPLMPYSPMLPQAMFAQLTDQMQAQMQIPANFPSSCSMINSVVPPAVPTAVPSREKLAKLENSSDVPVDKPKRGRPRKVKKTEKCLDEELCDEVTNGIEKEDKDRQLMPPPALPIGFGRTNSIS